jgi:hypothetical protein
VKRQNKIDQHVSYVTTPFYADELDPNKGEELVYVNANLFLHFTRIFGSKETYLQGRKEWENKNIIPAKQGCQIFLGTKYKNGKNISNYHELYPMSIKYNKCP